MTMNKVEYNRQRYENFKPIYDDWIKLYPLTLENLPGEVWKVIPNYGGAYHCSNFGRVKSFKKGEVKIRKPHLDTGGYLTVNLCKNSKQKCFKIARLVAELFLENPENKPEVNHLHGRWNNYFGSLEWATSSENTRHAVDTGLKVDPQGEDCHQAKLTNEQVIYIRNNPDGLNTLQLAEKFEVTAATISDIQLGKKYKTAGGTVREKKYIRLSEKQREEILTLWATGNYTQKQLGRMFNVDPSAISRTVNRRK